MVGNHTHGKTFLSLGLIGPAREPGDMPFFCSWIQAITMEGMSAAAQLIRFDAAGIAVSAGSACSSGKVEASHVLSAMGLSQELAQGAIRVSLGFGTVSADIERFISAWSELIKGMRQRKEAALTAA